MWSFSLACFIATTAQLHPLDGARVDGKARDILPAPRSLGAAADLWFVDIVNMQLSGGGMAAFDPMQFSSHGRSWKHNTLSLNGLDITDPARPGLAIFDVPHYAWTQLRYTSLWTARAGLHLRIDAADKRSGAGARAGYSTEVGGGVWIPNDFMDREPAVNFGAPEDRRRLVPAREAEVFGATRLGGGDLWLHTEHIDHRHRYLTLAPADRARRTTVLTGYAHKTTGNWLLGWQGRDRRHEGAQFRLPRELTHDVQAHAFLGQWSKLKKLDSGLLKGRGGLTMRQDTQERRGDTPIIRDIENEWIWTARPQHGERLQRFLLDGEVTHTRDEDHGNEKLSATFQFGQWRSDPNIVDGREATTYVRGGSLLPSPAVSITEYEPTVEAEEWLRRARVSWERFFELGAWQLDVHAALDQQAVGGAAQQLASFWGPAAGAAIRRSFGHAEFFAFARHEPMPLTAELASFLNPQRPSGMRYQWNDDGDLVPEAGETGALLGRTGGRYHRMGSGTKRPTVEQVAVGYTTPRFGPFQFTMTWVGRFHLNQFTVRYQQSDEGMGYTAVPFLDPGGDGRGEERRVPGGGQALTAYERDLSFAGDELYVVRNAKRIPFYTGAEVQLFTWEEERWFMRLGGAGYWLYTGAPFGSFPDRNDPGVIHEASADPNNRLFMQGRADQDRSFGLNLAAGVEPVENASIATALRYRDGQPFTRIVVVPDLPQGPTPLMAVRRGRPRHTFHLTVDVRARYAFELGPWQAATTLDCYNLLNSGTEQLEDPRTGPGFYRTPLEMVPGRTVYVALELMFGAS